MKMVSADTIRKNIDKYAFRAGFVVVRNFNSKYCLFDVKMDYYTHKNVDMDTVVRVVIDELYAMKINSPS